MTDERTTPDEGGLTLSAGMLQPYLTFGPYTTLQEAAARLSRNPVGVIMDEAGQPVTVVVRETLLALLGGGKDADRAHGKMGARQQARERHEGTSNTSTLVSLREDLPPLVTAAVGTDLADLAAQVRTGGAVGVLATQDGKGTGVLLSRSLLRRVPDPAPTEAEEAAPAPAPVNSPNEAAAPA